MGVAASHVQGAVELLVFVAERGEGDVDVGGGRGEERPEIGVFAAVMVVEGRDDTVAQLD